MEKLAMCRICMSEDVRMYYLVNTNLQETYEKLVDMPFEMKGARPLQVCYMCYARLQNCHQLRVSCLQSEELFHQMLKNTGFELTVLHDMNRLQVVHPPLVQLSIVPEASCHSDGDVDTRDDHMIEQFRIIPDMQDYNEDAPVPIKQEQTKLKDEFDTEIKFKPNKSFLKRLQTIYQTNIEKKKYKSNGADIKKCEICDKRFSRYSKLLRHLRKHTDDKPYKCQICEKSYKHKTHLLCHIRIHTDEKVVKSGEKCINQVDIVSKYNFVHNDEKHYKCDICGKLFFTKATLSSHLRTHTGIKPHKCNMCDKAFGIKATLIKHIRLHTGEKPFQCKLCGTCFRQQITLTKHMRLHTGEKPYKCNVCQKCFTEKGNLTRHFLIHTGEKPYKCEICKKSFNQKVTLSKHYYTH